MIDIEKLCTELNEALPAWGWPLRYPLRAFQRDFGKIASSMWSGGLNGERKGYGPEIGLQLYERDRRPVLIVFETDHCTGTAEPEKEDVAGIIATLNEFRWVIAPPSPQGDRT